MIKTYLQAVKFLEKYIPTPEKKHPGELGLRRMKYLMDMLGNPQLKYPTIHVGGTSGKGSTATIIVSILATRYKVGLHTSPHLVKINERIKVFMKDISDKEFVELVNEIHPAIRKTEESELGKPSYFEIVAAMAFLYFAKEKVDIAVIEVGMGGRYDATNVIKPLVAVLTNVGLDHTEILGDTVEKIAEDKAGIIKSGIQVVTGAGQPSVIKIISAKCKMQNAKLSLLGRDFNYRIKSITDVGSVFDYKGDRELKNLKLRLLGEHQIENAALAIRAIEKLSVVSCQLSVENIKTGLEEAYIPGRMEIVSRKPLVILDGAHNPDKVKALVASIKKIFPNKKVTAIVAIKNDKNAKEMLREFLQICDKKVIFTKFQLTADIGIISSFDPRKLLTTAQIIYRQQQRYGSSQTGVVKMLVVDDVRKAINKTISQAGEEDLILVTGSLYLVGEVRKFLITNY